MSSTYCIDNFLYNLVHEYLKTVSDELAKEFYNKYFFYDDPNLPVTTVQELVKKYYHEHKCDNSDTFEKHNPITSIRNYRNTSNDDEELLNSVVYQYLKTVSDNLAKEFKREHFNSVDLNDNSPMISIQDVVKKYLDDHKCDIGQEPVARSVKIKTNHQQKISFEARKVRAYFTAEEDKILLEALQNEKFPTEVNEFKNSKLFTDLRIQLKNRSRNTIIARLNKLKRGSTRRAVKGFSLVEDKIIIDEAISYLKNRCLLKTIFFPNNRRYEEFAAPLKRNIDSVRGRWNTFIKTWLLQYYNKTLNLEIRPMLANAIADNFETREEIDWEVLTTFPDFLGHTEHSLRFNFKTILQSYCKNFKDKSRSNVNLKNLATFASKTFQLKKVLKTTEKRQQEVIEYFEEQVKIYNIKDFL